MPRRGAEEASRPGLRLPVDEVVHDGHVVLLAVLGPQLAVAVHDLHASHDPARERHPEVGILCAPSPSTTEARRGQAWPTSVPAPSSSPASAASSFVPATPRTTSCGASSTG